MTKVIYSRERFCWCLVVPPPPPHCTPSYPFSWTSVFWLTEIIHGVNGYWAVIVCNGLEPFSWCHRSGLSSLFGEKQGGNVFCQVFLWGRLCLKFQTENHCPQRVNRPIPLNFWKKRKLRSTHCPFLFATLFYFSQLSLEMFLGACKLETRFSSPV